MLNLRKILMPGLFKEISWFMTEEKRRTRRSCALMIFLFDYARTLCFAR